MHGKIENCLFITYSLFKPGFQKERKIIFCFPFSEIKIVREHSSCFIAYKCGITLQRIVGLQVTAPRLMHEYFMWVFSLLAHWIAFSALFLAESHRLGIAQIDKE